MTTSKPMQAILPWANAKLEALLLDLIEHGTEIAKVDFKAEIEIGTPEQKSELLKDIIALANTYDESYEDHGFLIYGVKEKAITGIKHTEANTEKLQNTIEQLLQSFIFPMPQIRIVGFNAPAGKWGAIVISPRNNKPYMFFKELQCQNPRYMRKKGEWFVRRGSTTDSGLPEDLALITQRQTELLLAPLHESIRSLQLRVAKTEEQYNSALFKLVERVAAVSPESVVREPEDAVVASDIDEALGMDLPTRFKRRLRTPKDALAEALIVEAKAIRDYLDGAETGLPWAPQLNNVAANKKIIEEIEEKTRAFQLSVATVVLNDSKNEYTKALLQAVKMLAKVTETPNGAHNRIGEALRYYPLGLILYTIFICGVATGRGDLLKQVLKIPLKHRRGSSTSHITDIFFYWHDADVLFNDAYTQRWCEPIPQRIRQVINDRIGEMIPEVTEPEYFFRGEFMLALTHIDASISRGDDVIYRTPLAGLYLYFDEAHRPISDLLLEHPDWIDGVYARPLNEILDMFDQNAHKMVATGGIPLGLHGLKTSDLYKASLQSEAKKEPAKSL